MLSALIALSALVVTHAAVFGVVPILILPALASGSLVLLIGTVWG